MILRSIQCLSVLAVIAGGMPRVDVKAQSASLSKPNIIVILVDDLGYRDLSLHGSPDLKTPNIDAFVNGGVHCTDGYVSAPVCAPTRAGLLTGRCQQRFGFEFNPTPGSPAGELGLPSSEITLAEALQENGYATGMVGKWHLGGVEGSRPPECGFDDFFGFLEGAHSFLPPTDPAIIADPRPSVPFVRSILRGNTPVREKEYLTNAFTREAVAYIDAHRTEPFFLYLSYNAVHSPMHGDVHNFDRVAGIGPPRRKQYASMLVSLDDGVGKVMAKLRELELEENTLVFFLSDNGGSPQPFNTTDNIPFSGMKGELLEGGIRVPFFVNWKGTLPAGKVYSEPVSSLDIFATSIALAGGQLAKDRTYDGVNLIPFFQGRDTSAPHAALYWRYGEYLAIRKGDWKLHKYGKYPGQLYNLTHDIVELVDLKKSNPSKAHELEEDLAHWEAQLQEPLWGHMPPHEKNSDWLFEAQQDPSLQPAAIAAAQAAADANLESNAK